MKRLMLLVGCLLLPSVAALANRPNVDVVVPISPELGRTDRSTTPVPCNRCCLYQNQSYSEGAVLKVDNTLLQCTRDPNVVGTNPLIWVRFKQ